MQVTELQYLAPTRHRGCDNAAQHFSKDKSLRPSWGTDDTSQALSNQAKHRTRDAGKGDSLHVTVELRVGVEEDAVELRAQLRQHVLPAAEQDAHARPLVPAEIQHARVHVRMRLHDRVRPRAPPLDGLHMRTGQRQVSNYVIATVASTGFGKAVTCHGT